MAASASGSIDGSSLAKATGLAEAGASYATAMAAMNTTDQAIARFVGTPLASDVSKVKSANTALAAGFGSGSTVFALGEVGGAYDTSGLGSETINSSTTISIDPTLIASRQHLKLGLYGGTIEGQGFDSLTFTVDVNGKSALTQTFTTAAAAKTYFSNQVLDLDAISSNVFSVTVSLAETMSKAPYKPEPASGGHPATRADPTASHGVRCTANMLPESRSEGRRDAVGDAGAHLRVLDADRWMKSLSPGHNAPPDSWGTTRRPSGMPSSTATNRYTTALVWLNPMRLHVDPAIPASETHDIWVLRAISVVHRHDIWSCGR